MIQTRRYIQAGPSANDLHNFVAPSPGVDVLERFKLPVCDLQYDDAIDGIVTAIDAYMESLGFRADDGNMVYDVFARAGNPGAVPTRALVYAKTVGGVTQLYARSSDGAIVQLSPTQSPEGYIKGLLVSFTSISTVTIGTGRARDRLDSMDLVLAAPVVVNIAVAGVNGLDTGVEANNTWYYLYVIGDTTGVLPTAGIMSAAANAPLFPAGYNVARRVGSVRNQGPDFRDFQVLELDGTRSVQYRDALSTRQRLTGGAATVVTAISCGAVVPNTANYARFQMQQRGTVVASIYDDPAQLIANAQRTIPAAGSLYDVIRVSAGRDIAYANAAAGGLLDVFVTGYEESV